MDDVIPPATGEEALARLMRMFAHDSNNLLFAALASIDFAEVRGLPEEKRRAALEMARTNILSASHLNSNILRAMEARTAGRPLTWTDLGGTILEAAEMTRRDLPDRPLYISTAGPVERTEVMADRMLGDAISELFRNSLVHSPDGKGTVTVTLRKDGEDLIVSIEDRSGGMDPEEAKHASGRLRRAMGTGDHHGSGTGLSMVREVIDGYGWTLSFERIAGEGATGGLRAVLRVPGPEWRGG